MGGVLILFAVLIEPLLWADLTNPFVWIVLFVTLGYGVIGFVDDYKKAIRKNPKGISARAKLFGQIAVAGSRRDLALHAARLRRRARRCRS